MSIEGGDGSEPSIFFKKYCFSYYYMVILHKHFTMNYK